MTTPQHSQHDHTRSRATASLTRPRPAPRRMRCWARPPSGSPPRPQACACAGSVRVMAGITAAARWHRHACAFVGSSSAWSTRLQHSSATAASHRHPAHTQARRHHPPNRPVISGGGALCGRGVGSGLLNLGVTLHVCGHAMRMRMYTCAS
jgi:hypothetical protein